MFFSPNELKTIVGSLQDRENALNNMSLQLENHMIMTKANLEINVNDIIMIENQLNEISTEKIRTMKLKEKFSIELNTSLQD